MSKPVNGVSRADGLATHPEHGIVELSLGRLFMLPAPYELDGRVSTHPRTATGYGSMNCYLLVEGDEALLLDTGMSSHQELLLAQLSTLLDESITLSVWPTRLGEFNATCNVRPVIERFGAKMLYGNLANPGQWVDFRPEFAAYGTPVGAGALAEVETQVVRRNSQLSVDSADQRVLEVLISPLRLLPTFWVYDPVTKTMFTSDAYTYAWSDNPRGPWVFESGVDDGCTVEGVIDYLVKSRYWWLPGAYTNLIRADLDQIFSAHPTETIAPGFGCAFHGAEKVREHHQLLDTVLERLGREPSIGIETGGWSLKEGQR